MAQNPCDNKAADGSATSLSLCRVNEPDSATVWTYQEPNEVSSWGASLETVSRQPLSLDRAARKGTITSLSAEAGFTADQFIDNLAYFLDSLVFSTWKGNNPNATDSTGATATGYTVASGGATFAEGNLIYVSGFDIPANNGLKVVGAGSTATNISVTGLTADTSTGKIYKAGVQYPSGSLIMDAQGNLVSAASTVDFTTLNLSVGQVIGMAGFSTAADGTARVRAVTATMITLDHHSGVPAAITPAGNVSLYIGSFVRNVSMDHADYQCVPFTGEARYNTNPTTYEYARGMLLNQIAFNNSLEDKTTLETTFICEDVEAMTETRLPGIWENYDRTEAFNTSADFTDLRLFITGDLTGDTTFFKDTTLTINNNLSGESVLGKLGPEFINLGDFAVTLDTEVVLTDTRVAAAIRNNTTCGLQYTQQNNDGAIVVDLPTMTLGDGAKNIAANEKVKLTTTGTAFLDDDYGYVVGFSLFPYLPR